MSAKNSTPTSSPKPPKIVRVDAPSTPPSSKGRKRLLGGLYTPDALHDAVPFSPGLKRSNSGLLRSPETRLGRALSPYSANNLLKTPGNPEYDSDERDTPRRSKIMKTPQYFSPGKRLFTEDSSPNKKELGEISSQLKSRLSLAFGSLQQKEKSGTGVSPVKLDFSTGPFSSGKESPTRMAQAPPIASSGLNRANLNLQTLQASPSIGSLHSPSELAIRFSPEQRHQQQFSMPSPDEESSAHNALLVALSRLKERRRSQNFEQRRPSVGLGLSDLFHTSQMLQRKALHSGSLPLKLPPISVMSPNKPDDSSEQEAVYSLMSLSSPQKHDFNNYHSAPAMHPRSYVSSQDLSRSSSVTMPVLPPVSGLIRKVDDDETDVEDRTASEDENTP